MLELPRYKRGRGFFAWQQDANLVPRAFGNEVDNMLQVFLESLTGGVRISVTS